MQVCSIRVHSIFEFKLGHLKPNYVEQQQFQVAVVISSFMAMNKRAVLANGGPAAGQSDVVIFLDWTFSPNKPPPIKMSLYPSFGSIYEPKVWGTHRTQSFLRPTSIRRSCWRPARNLPQRFSREQTKSMVFSALLKVTKHWEYQ